MFAKSLTEIANIHGTDKGTIGPSRKWGNHNYTDVYEAYLCRSRLSPITILEIGLGVIGDGADKDIVHGKNKTGGASLKMWHDYFPNASIYGIDINPATHLDNDRIRTFVADQGNIGDLERFVDYSGGVEFDIIVDDGSHRPDHQQISLGFLFPVLKKGGLYFIEDLLANGLGDGATGRTACETVRNTRAVLRSFRKSGGFAEPNALIGAEYLAENIDFIAFHALTVNYRAMAREIVARCFRKRGVSMAYRPESERLCAIAKK